MSAVISAMATRSFGPGTDTRTEQGALLPHSATGLTGGYQLGYNRQFANRVECWAAKRMQHSRVRLTAQRSLVHRRCSTPRSTMSAPVRGRIGYAFDRLMPYATGGFAWGHTHINVNDGDGVSSSRPVGRSQTGWTAEHMGSNTPSAATGPPRPNTNMSTSRARLTI